MAATHTAQAARPLSLACHAGGSTRRRPTSSAARTQRRKPRHAARCSAPSLLLRRAWPPVSSPLPHLHVRGQNSARRKEVSREGTAIRELGSDANGGRRPKKPPVRSRLPTVHDEIAPEASLQSQSVMVAGNWTEGVCAWRIF
jgi:hypothetical protein